MREHLAVESTRNTIASGIKVQQCSNMRGAASLYSLIQHMIWPSLPSHNLFPDLKQKVIRESSYSLTALGKSISTFCKVKLVALKRSRTVCQITVIRAVSSCCICFTNPSACSPVSALWIRSVHINASKSQFKRIGF